MSDKQRCIHRFEDGKRCEFEARPGGLFCETHRTATEVARSPASGSPGGGGGVTGWFLGKIRPVHAPRK
jgi:hypothetical protein